ncbi:sulfurtransferase [Acetobacteraceae bacterium H6797]|nr:sulfurtransferase [Acetobacteraceae bacterium H6797]
MQSLVTTEWLAGQLGKPGLVLLDATYYLPTEKKEGDEEFLKAHIPGARYFNINVVADQETDLPHMAPTAGRFARLVGAMGISNDSTVIFYDQTGTTRAPRGWWLFKLFGHDKVAVLDGGLPKWVAEGRPTEAGAPAPAPIVTFVPDLRAEKLAGIGDVKKVVAGERDALLIDARARGRFEATAPEPRPGLPAGHMPGAQNIPATELMGPDGAYLPPEALKAKFAAVGADGSRPVITTCGTGVTACVLALGLEAAGLPAATVYDGSWTEWAGRPETQKVGGAA